MFSTESQVISFRSGVMEATGMESLEIDRGALYSGQRLTAEETRSPRVVIIRVQGTAVTLLSMIHF